MGMDWGVAPLFLCFGYISHKCASTALCSPLPRRREHATFRRFLLFAELLLFSFLLLLLWGSGILRLWDSGTLGFRATLEFWESGILGFWDSETKQKPKKTLKKQTKTRK